MRIELFNQLLYAILYPKKKQGVQSGKMSAIYKVG